MNTKSNGDMLAAKERGAIRVGAVHVRAEHAKRERSFLFQLGLSEKLTILSAVLIPLSIVLFYFNMYAVCGSVLVLAAILFGVSILVHPEVDTPHSMEEE